MESSTIASIVIFGILFGVMGLLVLLSWLERCFKRRIAEATACGRKSAFSDLALNSYWFSEDPVAMNLLLNVGQSFDSKHISDLREMWRSERYASKLYFEAHVTIDPAEGDELVLFKRLCEVNGFHVADLVMVKPGVGDQPSQRDSFCTARAKDQRKLEQMLRELVRDLHRHGFKVRRYKIEDTTIDSRIHDQLRLLPEVEVTVAVDTSKVEQQLAKVQRVCMLIGTKATDAECAAAEADHA